MSDIRVFHMMNGDMVIGDILSMNGDMVKVKMPCYIMVNPTSNPNQPSVSFTPMTMFHKDDEYDLKISFSSIAIEPYPCSENIRNAWNSMFGSGIITPDSKLIR